MMSWYELFVCGQINFLIIHDYFRLTVRNQRYLTSLLNGVNGALGIRIYSTSNGDHEIALPSGGGLARHYNVSHSSGLSTWI